jgi:RHS repeat-associated protein
MEKTNGSSGTMYWPGPSGTLTESDLTGTINEEYVYFNGQRIARVDRPSGTVHYYFSNHLGSHTMVTSATGSCEQDIDYFPYGGVVIDHCPNVAQHYKFTGKERDSESGLDNFGVRYNSSSLGRFMTPDPKMISHQRMLDPQQWDMYQYGRNNPITMIDPDGNEVQALTQLALQRIQSTVPSAVRSQITANKNGVLNRSAIDGIKSSDSNAKLLQQAVDSSKTIQVTTGPSVAGGTPAEIVGMPFSYESVAAQQDVVKKAGGDPSVITEPSLYLGYTQTPKQSPSGNALVTLSDGTGAAASTPGSELSVTTAHELYGHALPMVNGQPWQHDNGGPVDQKIKGIEDHTQQLNQNDSNQSESSPN